MTVYLLYNAISVDADNGIVRPRSKNRNSMFHQITPFYSQFYSSHELTVGLFLIFLKLELET